jgi:hypothetical protein
MPAGSARTSSCTRSSAGCGSPPGSLSSSILPKAVLLPLPRRRPRAYVAEPGGAGTERVARGFGPRASGPTWFAGRESGLARGPRSEAQIFTILHKISRLGDY